MQIPYYKQYNDYHSINSIVWTNIVTPIALERDDILDQSEKGNAFINKKWQQKQA